MADWQQTHGKVRGSYLSIDGHGLYVREGRTGGWLAYVDGRLEASASEELRARAAAETAVRCMDSAEAGGMTAATRHLRSAT